jgi:hypothetical protein
MSTVEWPKAFEIDGQKFTPVRRAEKKSTAKKYAKYYGEQIKHNYRIKKCGKWWVIFEGRKRA